MRILFVDDDKEIRDLMEELLQFLGHRICSAVNGGEALALLEDFGPDIVITDRRMSGMSGEELIRHIKKSKPHLPIILMTADYLSSAEQNVIAAAGAGDVVQKPFSEEDLKKALEHAVKVSPVLS